MTTWLVCGGRDYANVTAMEAFLSSLINTHGKPTLVVHGAAPGADRLAASWFAFNGIRTKSYPANWEVYGRSAGPKRNARMLTEAQPDLVIAFPGGRGTADMIARSLAVDIEVVRVGG